MGRFRLGTYCRLFRRWLQLWRGIPVTAWLRGATSLKDGNYYQAIYWYEKGLSKQYGHPAEHCARLDLALCLEKVGCIREAQHQLEYVKKRLPQSREVALRLARLQIRGGCFLAAMHNLATTMKHHPHDREMAGNYLLAALDNGGPKDSIEMGRAQVKRLGEGYCGPDICTVAAICARIQIDKDKQARAELATIAESCVAPQEASIYLADLLLENNQAQQARKILRTILRQDPTDPRLLVLLAESYLSEPRPDYTRYARQLAEAAAVKSNWTNCRCLIALAVSYLKEGDRLTALLLANKAQLVGKAAQLEHDFGNLEDLIEHISVGQISS